MSERDEADTPFAAVFTETFGKSVNVKQRITAERRAGRTPKERSRGGKGPLRNVQINVRGTAKTKALIERIAEILDGSHADVIEAAVAMLAKSYKLEV